jgi:hypothetical protein
MKEKVARRNFLKTSAIALGAAVGNLNTMASAVSQDTVEQQGKSLVFFTKEISAESLLRIYGKVNSEIRGKIAIKLHSGEPHGANLLPIDLIKGLQRSISDSTIGECNVLYQGPRQKTETHRETLKTNGFDFCAVDIMDEDGDVPLAVPGMEAFLGERGAFAPEHAYTPGWHLTEVSVGKNLPNYDSLVVYTHFKGHPMGGFGGSLRTSPSAARLARAANSRFTDTAGRVDRSSWNGWSKQARPSRATSASGSHTSTCSRTSQWIATVSRMEPSRPATTLAPWPQPTF